VYSTTYILLGRSLSIYIGNPGQTLILVSIIGLSIVLINKSKIRGFLHSNESRILLLWFIWIYFIAIFVFPSYYNGPFSPIFRVIIISLLLFLYFNNARSLSHYKLLFNGFAIAAVLSVVVSLLLGLPNYFAGNRIGTIIMDNTNDYAYMLILVAFGVFYKYYTQHNKNMIWLVVLILLSLFIVLSGSRKAFLGILFFAVVFYTMRYSKGMMRKPTRIIQLLVTFFILAIVVAYVFENTLLGERLDEAYYSEKTSSNIDDRLTGRGAYYSQGYELFMDNIVIGVGIGNFHFYEHYGQVTHSEYVSLLAEGGLISFLLYFSIYFITIRNLLRLLRRRKLPPDITLAAQIFLVGLLTILLLDFGRWNYNHPQTYIFLAFANQLSRYSKKQISV
jgi:hypothetical protein